MRVDEFDFELPEELIAQQPLADRSSSRLLHLDKQSGAVSHRRFVDIVHLLKAGDVLVLNDTKVLPARLFGVKENTGAKVEVLLLKQLEGDTWETLVKPAKRVKPGVTLNFGDGRLRATCTGSTDAGGRVLHFAYAGIFQELLAELGQMPLPPYIKAQLDDPDRYQTVYARHEGSAAAPTAGLHFTPAILQALKAKGVMLSYITLHVGLGTFRPVQVDEVEEHKMHAEFFQMSARTAQMLNQAQHEGRRIIAVGTTSVRTLETVARDYQGEFRACSGWTDIFIYPGFRFQAISGMLTNFHLPKSTLIMLVSAFAGNETIMRAYREAVQERYRFFSFGDAMLIV
ncbi:S-adenosylmethionine:tRNA ribosyltransferase-isomerase [Caldalkalibacillus uzonensis]|uniref:S-adenosylmethionine:tRNA ribosyltransferase-isomerase n=1 Tax=Caldalkalibacillus uzonensis TaxID=353224 RepID=A0ABU0CSX7_9BACI|nr:tRNA preQ1(34) S-adenosylmethionine ribosyltransferase-isomerase QueA [Caldalkalibacillus uzonensis]MDQ0339518.1 S-adenosylmethionine:tRNA ribosyltransferase-isomerase [Caldalkalibacillus uzonensis]